MLGSISKSLTLSPSLLIVVDVGKSFPCYWEDLWVSVAFVPFSPFSVAPDSPSPLPQHAHTHPSGLENLRLLVCPITEVTVSLCIINTDLLSRNDNRERLQVRKSSRCLSCKSDPLGAIYFS